MRKGFEPSRRTCLWENISSFIQGGYMTNKKSLADTTTITFQCQCLHQWRLWFGQELGCFLKKWGLALNDNGAMSLYHVDQATSSNAAGHGHLCTCWFGHSPCFLPTMGYKRRFYLLWNVQKFTIFQPLLSLSLIITMTT